MNAAAKKPALWRVARTGEEQSTEPYCVMRRVEGEVEIYDYAETRAEAVELAAAANRTLCAACAEPLDRHEVAASRAERVLSCDDCALAGYAKKNAARGPALVKAAPAAHAHQKACTANDNERAAS